MIAKKNIFIGSMFAAATLATSSAATITELIGNTIVQTSDFSFNPNAIRTLDFAQFNTLGGDRVLDSVTVEVSYTKSGGRYSIDNDSEFPATVTLTHEISALVSSSGVVVVDLSKTGGGTIAQSGLRATSSIEITVAADDLDDLEDFNTGGDDFYRFNPASTTVGDSGTMLNTAGYVGAGSFSLNVNGLQDSSSTITSGMAFSSTSSTMAGFVKVTYNYTAVVPEPSSVALVGAFGALALLRRRR
jgi:hypothetical protein